MPAHQCVRVLGDTLKGLKKQNKTEQRPLKMCTHAKAHRHYTCILRQRVPNDL